MAHRDSAVRPSRVGSRRVPSLNRALLLHLLYFAVMIAVGVTGASRRLERLLLR